MAPKKRSQKGGDDVDAKLQHAVTTLNELAATLSAVLESRGATVPAADEAKNEETKKADEEIKEADEETKGADEETPAEGGGKKTKKKAAPKKK